MLEDGKAGGSGNAGNKSSCGSGRSRAAKSGQVRVDRRERVIDLAAEPLQYQNRNHRDQCQNQRVLDQALS